MASGKVVLLWTLVVLIFVMLAYLLITATILASRCGYMVYKYYGIRPLDLAARYGAGTWVLITGSSSGMGREFARNFAARGFNIILSGSRRNYEVQKELRREFPNTKSVVIIKNFSESFRDGFFDEFEDAFRKFDITVVINNLGHRSAWRGYHEMPADKIRDTIACGTMVQAMLTQIAIRHFLPYMRRTGKKCALVNITSQCMHRSYGLAGFWASNEISVPYLSVYEASNAFGFFHSNSIHKEYRDQFDLLTVTPGAVVTENTEYLKDTLFRVDKKKFVENTLKFLGNIQGITCASIGHEISEILVSVAPFVKDRELEKVGRTIADDYMKNGIKRRY